ncbi:MAG TPA: PhzF family phenazine biosynthesis isomerase, partial [Steroidobacteraceae bacterium]|nr:PhzF family phenazine biosynthesis isomerase [Steroidobacteraceae bacterium]
MKVLVHHWDAFAHEAGKGNPAGIVAHDRELTDDAMQAIAARIGFNDTAFVLASAAADLRLRYFAPRHEVDLCGHATIAAFCALQSMGRLPQRSVHRLETRSGILPIEVTSANGVTRIVMTQS